MNGYEYGYVEVAKLNGNTVFIIKNCDPLVNYVPAVYDCTGNQIDYTSQLERNLSDIKIAWRDENSKCVFR
jgi:hypothetical protein